MGNICSQTSLVVQLLSRVRLFATPWTAAHKTSLSFTISQRLLKLIAIELVMPYNHLVLSPPSSPALNLSHHQGLFQWVSSLYQVTKLWEIQFQHHSFQWVSRVLFPLGLTVLISLLSKGLSRVCSSTTFWKQSLVHSLLSGPTLTSVYNSWENYSFDYTDLCWQTDVSAF